ncbi:ubiquitin-like protein [Paenibacillus aurantius]|uniref:Ubiquitin-like protein n=1 Tax=Paenibacillus aurantius TaxID=2918900 RepID=A0AA96LAF9_9BACL|nr:ubiquitin-like protein [Paenibacillus aurantius]WNQ09648.1 ubiquitin-like protein [Paenibacillus aurantius]
MKDKTITLTVETGKGPITMDFEKTIKVVEAAKKAAAEKGYPDGNYVFVHNGGQMQPERPLVSYHLEDGAKVVLSATGDNY